MLLFGLLVQKISSLVEVKEPVDYGMGDVGVYDIVRDESITFDGAGIFCEVKVDSVSKPLSYPAEKQFKDLSIVITKEINDDVAVIKYVVTNNGENKAFSIGTYYDLDEDNGDQVVQMGSKNFYVQRYGKTNIYHILESTNSYIGPDKYWYGKPSTSNPADYYYRDSSSALGSSRDIGIAFSFNDIQINHGETKTLGFMIAFMNSFPEISFKDPGNDAYEENEEIRITEFRVSNSKKGIVKFDFNCHTVHSVPYDSPGSIWNTQVFNIDTPLTYKTDKYCLQIYAEAELKTQTKEYCFWYKNTPVITGDVQVSPVPGTQNVKISGSVQDKDAGKMLHLYAEIEGTTSSNNQISSFTSNGNSNTFEGNLDISNHNGNINIQVWISSDDTSTVKDDGSYYSKSKIKTVSYEIPSEPVSTKPTLSVNFPTTTSYTRNQKIQLSGTVSGEGDITMKFIIDDSEISYTKPLSNGEFNFEFGLPNDIQVKGHSLKVYVIDNRNTPSVQSNPFSFTVVNSPPTIQEVSISKESVEAGEEVTITGKVQDIDPQSPITIKAKNGDKIFGQTSVTSNGEPQGFTISFNAEDVTEEKSYEISVEASDGTDSSTSTTKPRLTIRVPKPKLVVNFPSDHNFPRNKKIHLKGTTSPNKDYTMKFIIDGRENVFTQAIQNGAFEFDFDLPSGISLGHHTLKVYIIGTNTQSEQSEEFGFNVQNTLPVITEPVLESSSIESGEQVTLTGKIQDIDSGSQVTITAKHDLTTLGQAIVTSNGNTQDFTIRFTAEEVEEEKSFDITIEANDGEGTFTSTTKPRLTIRVKKPKLSVTFPNVHEFPRNKMIHLKGSTTPNKDYTMKFIIDNKEIETTKPVQNGEFDFDFELPNGISLGSHTLKVYVMGSNIQSDQSDEFGFNVQNTLPVLSNVALQSNSVMGGEQVTITGNIQDIDPESTVTINAKNGENVLGHAIVKLNGESQIFTIQFTTEDVITETSYDLTFDANDGTGTYIHDNHIHLTVKVPNPTFTVTFPNPNKFPRNKKVHLKGTTSGKGELTMKFFIDDREMKKQIQVVPNGAYDFEFDLPNGIKIGSHKLIAYIIDNKNRRSVNSTTYEFNVENTRPVIEDLEIKKSKVESGEKVIITGKIQDIDAGSQVTITARYGDKKSAHIIINSDGTLQPFTIEFPADEVTKDTTFSITFDANDGTDTFKSESRITLTVTPKKVNPPPQPQPPQPKPGPEKQDPNKDESDKDKDKDKKDSDKQDPGKEKDKTNNENETETTNSQKERELEKQRRTYIIVGVVIGCLVVIAIVAGVSFYLLKKQGSNNTITESGYQKDEAMEP